MKVEIPADIKTFELSGSVIWFDEDGILYSVPKPDIQPTIQEMEADITSFKTYTGNRKVCIIIESSSRSEVPNKEEREFIAKGLAEVVKAMAIITRTPLSKMIANLFFAFKPPPYPTKMFTDVVEAREWILKHCNK